ncbi:MAG: hypothetical protein OXB88_01465 [Bacteriovoracales bacterium]|nr:hypothetical protein [Bacteriovoracales bacterium]
MIDRERIPPPRVELSQRALEQLCLMRAHDPTLMGQCIRIQIAGKGCEGFRYALGFGLGLPEDIVVESCGLSLHFDPFCAFYLQEGLVDYQILPSGEDGFVVTNAHEEKYRGKFWKDRKDLVPPQVSSQEESP